MNKKELEKAHKDAQYQKACRVSDYLLKTGQGFCFMPNGELATKQGCQNVIDDYNTIK